MPETTTRTLDPAVIKDRMGNGKAFAPPRSPEPTPLGSLLAIGDKFTLRLNGLAAITQLTGHQVLLVGISGQRTASARFRVTSDPSATSGWSPWAQLSTLNLTGAATNPDQPLFVEVEWERTGSDTTGVIDIMELVLLFTYDKSAPQAHGQFDELTVYDYVPAAVRAIIEQAAPAKRHNSAVNFHNGGPEGCQVDDRRVVVYCYRVRTRERYQNNLQARVEVEFTVGIRRTGSKETETYFNQVRALLKQRLGWNANAYRYDVKLGDVQHLGVFPSAFGMSSLQTLGDADRTPTGQRNTGCGPLWWECLVQFSFQTETL